MQTDSRMNVAIVDFIKAMNALISRKSSLEVFAVLSETLSYSKISANPSRMLHKETDHELLHHWGLERQSGDVGSMRQETTKQKSLSHHGPPALSYQYAKPRRASNA
jgi:hypothetical protein